MNISISVALKPGEPAKMHEMGYRPGTSDFKIYSISISGRAARHAIIENGNRAIDKISNTISKLYEQINENVDAQLELNRVAHRRFRRQQEEFDVLPFYKKWFTAPPARAYNTVHDEERQDLYNRIAAAAARRSNIITAVQCATTHSDESFFYYDEVIGDLFNSSAYCLATDHLSY